MPQHSELVFGVYMNIIWASLHKVNAISAWPSMPLQQLALLGLRGYIAWVFLTSGLVKVMSWENTVFLFQYEYQVPLLSYTLAAVLATAGELIFPVLLGLGLLSRLAAVALLVINWMALSSFGDMPAAAEILHYLWGLVLVVLALWGGGFIALDRLLPEVRVKAKTSL